MLLAVSKLDRKICRHYGTVRRRCIGKNLGDTEDLTVELNLDADHVVGSLSPNRATDLEIHGRVAGRFEVKSNGERALLLQDYLNSHSMYLSYSILKVGKNLRVLGDVKVLAGREIVNVQNQAR